MEGRFGGLQLHSHKTYLKKFSNSENDYDLF